MDTPGISVRPLINMADEHVFNEIVFDNVRIPVKYLVGEENRGWYIGMTTLDFERSNISTAAQYRRTFEQLVGYVKESEDKRRQDDRRRTTDFVKAKLADLAIENEVGRYLSYRVASMQERNQIPNYESSAAKVYHSEYGQRLAGAGVNIMGLYGSPRRGVEARPPPRPLRPHLPDLDRQHDRGGDVGDPARDHRAAGTWAEPDLEDGAELAGSDHAKSLTHWPSSALYLYWTRCASDEAPSTVTNASISRSADSKASSGKPASNRNPTRLPDRSCMMSSNG